MSASSIFSGVNTVLPASSALLATVKEVFPPVGRVLPGVGRVFPGVRSVLPPVGGVFPGVRSALPAVGAALLATGMLTPAARAQTVTPTGRLLSTTSFCDNPWLRTTTSPGLLQRDVQATCAIADTNCDGIAQTSMMYVSEPFVTDACGRVSRHAIFHTQLSTTGTSNCFIGGGVSADDLWTFVVTAPTQFHVSGTVRITASNMEARGAGIVMDSGPGRITANGGTIGIFGNYWNINSEHANPVTGAFAASGTLTPATYRYSVGAGCDDILRNPASFDGFIEATIIFGAATCCDDIDFNNNNVFPEDQDVIDFFHVLAGAECPSPVCNDIDFNNNGVFPEDQDVIDFFNVLAGGTCP